MLTAFHEWFWPPSKMRMRSALSPRSSARPSLSRPTGPRSDILQEAVPAVKTLDAQPLENAAAKDPTPPSPPRLEELAVTGPARLAIVAGHAGQCGANRHRTVGHRLAASAPTRRLSLAEANDPVLRKELGNVEIRIAGSAAAATPITSGSPRHAHGVGTGPGQARSQSRRPARRVGTVPAQPGQVRAVPRRADPRGAPAGPLTELQVKQADAAAQPGSGFTIDGEVTDAEVAVSWKSGQFRIHVPGPRPMPSRRPIVYVGKTEKNGRPYLYVSFVCIDPRLDQLVLAQGNGVRKLCEDDGIEIYLDTKFDRRTYYQMIVNAAAIGGQRSPEPGRLNYRFEPAWNPDQQLKTTINKQAGRWTCEVLIPFDRVGGVPDKGSRWGVNFCRNYRGQPIGKDDHLQTWFLVFDKERNYHNPQLFGIFEW